MSKSFSIKGALVAGLCAFLAGVGATAVSQLAGGSGSGGLVKVLEGRDSALATFVGLVHATQGDAPNKRMARLMNTLVKEGDAISSPVAYVGVLDGEGQLKRVWVALERLKRAFPGAKSRFEKSPRQVFSALTKKGGSKRRLESYSVSLPGGAGSVKMGFFVPAPEAGGGWSSYLGILLGVVGALGAAVVGGVVFSGVKGKGVAGGAVDPRLVEKLEDLGVVGRKKDGQVLAESLLEAAKERLEEESQGMEELQTFVPQAIFKKLAAGGPFPQSEKVVTVAVVELGDVETLGEQEPSQKAMDTINTYLDIMVETFRERDAVVGEVSPEGVVAWWGNPDPIEQGEAHALETLGLLRKRLGDLKHRQSTVGERILPVKAGLATGRGLLCRVGSVNRLSSALVGSAWARARRLCAAGAPEDVVVDASSYEKVEAGEHPAEVLESAALGELKAVLYKG